MNNKWLVIRSRSLFKTLHGMSEDGIIQYVITHSNIFPTFIGGFDHIKRTDDAIYVYDIGCNGRDNSFVVRPE